MGHMVRTVCVSDMFIKFPTLANITAYNLTLQPVSNATGVFYQQLACRPDE